MGCIKINSNTLPTIIYHDYTDSNAMANTFNYCDAVRLIKCNDVEVYSNPLNRVLKFYNESAEPSSMCAVVLPGVPGGTFITGSDSIPKFSLNPAPPSDSSLTYVYSTGTTLEFKNDSNRRAFYVGTKLDSSLINTYQPEVSRVQSSTGIKYEHILMRLEDLDNGRALDIQAIADENNAMPNYLAVKLHPGVNMDTYQLALFELNVTKSANVSSAVGIRNVAGGIYFVEPYSGTGNVNLSLMTLDLSINIGTKTELKYTERLNLVFKIENSLVKAAIGSGLLPDTNIGHWLLGKDISYTDKGYMRDPTFTTLDTSAINDTDWYEVCSQASTIRSLFSSDLWVQSLYAQGQPDVIEFYAGQWY